MRQCSFELFKPKNKPPLGLYSALYTRWRGLKANDKVYFMLMYKRTLLPNLQKLLKCTLLTTAVISVAACVGNSNPVGSSTSSTQPVVSSSSSSISSQPSSQPISSSSILPVSSQASSSSSVLSSSSEVSSSSVAQADVEIIVELESFVATGANGKVGGDTVKGFGRGDTSVNWVTNGDYGDYNVEFPEAGTYKAFITISQKDNGSYGARVNLNDWPAAWGYMTGTGSWETAKEFALPDGHFVVTNAGMHTLRVEAFGGSDWQWSGDKLRIVRVGPVTSVPTPIYDPDSHTDSDIAAPASGFQYLKKPVNIPVANRVLKSDVWYTYPQNKQLPGYDDFQATGSFWGHPPEHDFFDETTINNWVDLVQGYRDDGLKYVARGEFDWGFRWFTEYVTNPEPHYVRTLDDSIVRMTFMGYHSYKGYNNNWMSNHSPAFVPFFKAQVDNILKANISHLMFDSQTSSTRATDMATFGGDFSYYAMKNFRKWLDVKYSNRELADLGISDISSFDYKQHLLDAGVTHQTFLQSANTLSGSVPLLEDFIYFNRDVWNQKFGEVLAYIREKRPDIEIGASTHLFESRGYIFNENITFLANELDLVGNDISEMPTGLVIHLKGAEAVNKILALFPYPSEFKLLKELDAPRFGRGWVAQSYAMGGLFSIPADVWVGGTDTWSPGADNYRDIYLLASEQGHLLDGYTSYAKAALLHPMYSSMKANFINGSSSLAASTRALVHGNINFDLLVFGDEGYEVVPRASDFDKYEVIFTDSDRQFLTEKQEQLLENYKDKLVHIGQFSNYKASNISVKVGGTAADKTVSAISRMHETKTNVPYVVHLLNRPFVNGATPVLDAVEVTIPKQYFPKAVKTATLHLPGNNSLNLPVSENANGDAVVRVNDLEVWGILELGH